MAPNRHLCRFLLLAVLSLSVSADVFVSIDCGSSQIYTDSDLIVWSADEGYIQNGESRVVPSTNSLSHVMDTLRVFTTRKRNCYSVKADQGGRVLVRASFFYGNYDGKSSPPTFGLQFDGNDWATVETSSTEYVYFEAIYVVKGDSVSVCVAQTKAGQFPFISALEVRSLAPTMYMLVKPNYALFLSTRVAFGANQTIRYIDDLYDRIWTPGTVGKGLIAVESDDAFSVNTNGADNPPRAIFQTAITAANVSDAIILGSPPAGVFVYLNFYFSEVAQLNSTEIRSFQLLTNGEAFSMPLIPPYGHFTELRASYFTFPANTTFSLKATNVSTLPPLINALELFIISDPLTDGTNTKDVESLASLQDSFAVLRDWSGDPCLPAPYSWDWISCSNSTHPRVTALQLGSYGLSGFLPDFSSMDGLEIIDLSNNSLIGPIPEFLGTLSNLKQLNLANNLFTGSVPASLSRRNGLNLVVTGNPDLCTSGQSCQNSNSPPSKNPVYRNSGGRKKKKSKLPVILGITIPVFVLIWAIAAVFAILHYQRKRAAIAVAIPGQATREATDKQGPTAHHQEQQ